MRSYLLAFLALAIVGVVVADVNAWGRGRFHGHRGWCYQPCCCPCPCPPACTTPGEVDETDPELEDIAELPTMTDRPQTPELPQVQYYTDN
jgi:hypothetical protein